MVPLFVVEIEFQPILVSLRVVEVQGAITWKLKSSKGSVRPGDALVAGITIYLEPRAVVICDDGSGTPLEISADENHRSIEFFGINEADRSPESERMVPMIREVYENLAMLGPARASVVMAQIVSRPSVQALAAEFAPNALALLNYADQTQLKVLPIREPDSNALLVVSDEWTPTKVLKVMERTNRRLSLALLTTGEFEELNRQIDKT